MDDTIDTSNTTRPANKHFQISYASVAWHTLGWFLPAIWALTSRLKDGYSPLNIITDLIGHPGFDNEIKKKIYNKLLALCCKGTAATYITKAAHFNGWEAVARFLLKKREKSLCNLVENRSTTRSWHQHLSSCRQVWKVRGQMAHNNPAKPPYRGTKDWLLSRTQLRLIRSYLMHV